MYYLGIDAGTSGLKTLLIDEQGNTVGQGSSSYALATPRPGWVEANPEDWWTALCSATRQVLDVAGISGRQVAAAGLSGQMHTLVLVDDASRPVRPAISWADARGAEERAEIESSVGRERIIAITGSPAVTAFTATKLLWVRRHEPEVWAKARTALLAKDYLRLRLTGAAATDPTDAGGTGLLDLEARDWSRPVLDALGLPLGMLPPITASASIAGTLSREAAEQTGLAVGMPVATGAGDQEAAALGSGALDPGPVLITVGTGGQIFAPTARPLVDLQGRVHSLPHVLPDRWHVLAAIPAAGLAVSWLQRFLPARTRGVVRPPASPPIFIPAIAGERTPSMDERARATLFGLTLDHGENELLFAAREGVAFALRMAFDVLMELELPLDPVVVTGGLSADASFLQLLADVLDRPLVPGVHREGSAYGAALLGALACDALPRPRQPLTRDEEIRPDETRVGWHEQRYKLYQQLSSWSRRMSHELAMLE